MIDHDELDRLLPSYLARQPWFAHGQARDRAGAAGVDAIVRVRETWMDGDPTLVWAIVDTTLDDGDAGAYQILIGLRPSVPSPGFLIGATTRILGTFQTDDGEWLAYDALIDPELTAAALEGMFDDIHGVRSVRKLTAGKTSTSVVADEQWLCKVFRRVYEGTNLGVDMPAKLWAHGFRATLETVESWHHDGLDLALRRPFLPGAANGIDLADASLRELFASGLDPQLSPGDFSAEARRIGTMLGQLHAASESAYGPGEIGRGDLLGDLVDQIVALRIEGLGREQVDAWSQSTASRLDESLPTIRVHGNLYLGQLLRSDQGWLILDFEGAPLLPTSQRLLRRIPWLDVGSMLRSFDYVAAMAGVARIDAVTDDVHLGDEAAKWVDRNARAFLDGYLVARHIPDSPVIALLVRLGEIMRATYEVAYERANRPELEGIPTRALRRLLGK